MALHVGRLLKELYLGTGLKMERFAEGVSYDEKTVYYHFGKAQLNTGILEKYEAGLKKMGVEVDIFGLISRKRKGYEEKPLTLSLTAEPRPASGETASDLLRRAALLLEKGRAASAPDRDNEGS